MCSVGPANPAFERTIQLPQATRDLRIDAAEGILRLLNALREEAEKKIATLKKVSDTRKS